MRAEIEDIIPERGEAYSRKVCALKVDGKSPALAGLIDLRNRHPEDYARLLKVIRLVAMNQEVRGKHVKQGSGQYRDIFEMRAGQERCFYFLEPRDNRIVICTNHYWKNKPSKREQNKAFENALSFRRLYLSSIGFAEA